MCWQRRARKGRNRRRFTIILDLDVASYYPNLSIVNRLRPEHLGEIFCDVYARVYELRKQYPKGTPENALFKLALNGIFGKSNSEFSAFYDPAFAMGVTINGQLLICMLAEWLTTIPGLSMIQANTDGVTVMLPRSSAPLVDNIARQWEQFTLLTLETVEYSTMAIRDVNNYVAIDIDGKVKTKGAYTSRREWHQNHSAMVIPMAATDYIVNGTDPEQFIKNHTDFFDFLLMAKVPRSSKLLHGEKQIQNITRYYPSTSGDYLVKEMPPLKTQTDKHAKHVAILNDPSTTWADKINITKQWGGALPSCCPPRRIGIDKQYRVLTCNNIADGRPELINYDYYINETHKLISAF